MFGTFFQEKNARENAREPPGRKNAENGSEK